MLTLTLLLAYSGDDVNEPGWWYTKVKDDDMYFLPFFILKRRAYRIRFEFGIGIGIGLGWTPVGKLLIPSSFSNRSSQQLRMDDAVLKPNT